MAIDVRMAVVTGVACKKMRAQHAAMPAREEFTSALILNQRVRVCRVIGTDDSMIQTLTSAEKFHDPLTLHREESKTCDALLNRGRPGIDLAYRRE
jgi:hypothetical protein